MTQNISVTYPFMDNPVPTAIGLFLLAFVMVLLNLTAIVVFWKTNRRKPPVDYPLLSLLIANLLQGFLTLPAYALKKIGAWGPYHQAIICDIYRFSYFVCAHASILSLLASSIDRLISLIYSLRYYQMVTRRRITMVLICIWIGIILFDSIPLLPIHNLHKESCHYVVTKAWSVTMHIVMNIIPLPILIASYIVTIRIAFKHARMDQQTTSSKLDRREKLSIVYNMKATRKVLLIIGSYFICVGPACVYYLLEWLCVTCFSLNYKQNDEQYVHFALKVLVNFNAVVSAIIFFWKNKLFRKKAKEVFSVRDRFSVDKKESVYENQKYALTERVNNGCDGNDNDQTREPSQKSFKRSLLTKMSGDKERNELLPSS